MKTAKTIKVRIGKKHLKGAIYLDNHDCPLARALKGKGYTRVWVGGFSASGVKNNKRVNFKLGDDFNSVLIGKGEPVTIKLEVA